MIFSELNIGDEFKVYTLDGGINPKKGWYKKLSNGEEGSASIPGRDDLLADFYAYEEVVKNDV